MLILGATTAAAEEATGFQSDYGALTEELPIDAPLCEPVSTFTAPDGISTNVYGQVNLTDQSFVDGQQITAGIVDNDNWNTRLGVTAVQPLGDTTLRYRFETGLGLRNSATVSQDFEPPVIDWQRTALRWFEIAAEAPYGTVSFGQGSTASDGTAGLDDSFTFVAGATNSADGFGSFRFRDETGALTDVRIGQVNASFNGARRLRLRYDTPVVNGVMLSASYGQNILAPADDIDYSDIAIRWTGDVGDFTVRSAAGYQWLDNPDGDSA
ncbi:MAG: porin [Rhodobacterales bacterium]|nr:porin [Rhodobacterales bacterium]